MKATNTDEAPKFNLLAPEGIRPQAQDNQITAVLLNSAGGQWYQIKPGSFHLYQSAAKPPAFGPYVAFTVLEFNVAGEVSGEQKVEVFPASVAGWSYE